MNYITMIFDINSRAYPDRTALQYLLIDLLKRCNTQFAEMLAAPFIITLGDEWQGLLKPDMNYLQIIDFFKFNLPRDISFYTGVGIGPITISNFELTVNQLDGPAFHLAREALLYAKRKKHSLVILTN
ncbi:SatD family protein [Cellulosilyticum ruminicola]|uniref:SatD family protein n=1 Tax=Cellulosilyticum ruminicola TaxID=425254 RepID=UPI0006CF266C|nr:SatD family protein [Cellulosilyticum ruminicola]